MPGKIVAREFFFGDVAPGVFEVLIGANTDACREPLIGTLLGTHIANAKTKILFGACRCFDTSARGCPNAVFEVLISASVDAFREPQLFQESAREA